MRRRQANNLKASRQYPKHGDRSHHGNFRNNADGSNAKDRSGKSAAVREIPGFYYDPNKKRYFKISKDHPRETFTPSQTEGSKDVCQNSSPMNINFNKPRKISVVKHLQQREYTLNSPLMLTKRDLLEKLSRLLKVKQKFSLGPDGDYIGLPLVRRLECDLSHEKLLTLYVIQRNIYETEEIIGFHSLTNDKNSNLEFSSQFSYVIASGKVTGLLWSPHESTKDFFIVSSLGQGRESGETLLLKSDFSWREMARCTAQGSSVWTNSWSRNPQFSNLISAGTSRGTLIWDITSRRVIKLKCASDVLAQEFSWGSPILYNGSRDGIIRTCDIRMTVSDNWPVLCMRQGVLASVTCIRALRDGNYLLSSGLDGSLKMWDLRTRACVQNYQGHINEITHKLPFHVDPTESLIFAAGQDLMTRIWSISSGELLHYIPFPENVDKSENPIPALYYSDAFGGRGGMPGLLQGAGESVYFYSF